MKRVIWIVVIIIGLAFLVGVIVALFSSCNGNEPPLPQRSMIDDLLSELSKYNPKYQEDKHTIVLGWNFYFDFNKPKSQEGKTLYQSSEEIRKDLGNLDTALALEGVTWPERSRQLQEVGQEVLKVLAEDEYIPYIEKITFVGCVDSQGQEKDNIGLAERRACGVACYYKEEQNPEQNPNAIFTPEEYARLCAVLQSEGRGSDKDRGFYYLFQKESGLVQDDKSRRVFIEIQLKETAEEVPQLLPIEAANAP